MSHESSRPVAFMSRRSIDHTSTRARILIEKALGCRRSSLPMTGLDLILRWPFPKFWNDAFCISWYGAGSLLWDLSPLWRREALEARMWPGVRVVAHGSETIVRWQSQHLRNRSVADCHASLFQQSQTKWLHCADSESDGRRLSCACRMP